MKKSGKSPIFGGKAKCGRYDPGGNLHKGTPSPFELQKGDPRCLGKGATVARPVAKELTKGK